MRFDIIEFTRSYGTAEQLEPSDYPEVVFSGRSNVGKSSLINKLFNRKSLARVSSVPGKTVTVNFFRGDGVNFVDLPGYGYARRDFSEKKRWSLLMEKYFKSQRSIALVVQLIDMRHAPSREDMVMLGFLRETRSPFIIALTKCDKLNKGERERRRQELAEELGEFANEKRIEFSGVTGDGVEEIRAAITEAVQQGRE